MISNRQGGRRRGRGGGQRPPNNVPNSGNRQDNRQRGNAAQLHEKYKALARDAQLSGDRVQTEYYLQFADHYFRVLNEGRARFEEQRRPREDESGIEDEDLDEAGNAASDTEDRFEREEQEERPRPRRNGTDRSRGNGRREREAAEDEVSGSDQSGEEPGEERISLDVLPPSIASEEGVRAPRRRTRRPRPESDEEIAPAA